MSSGCGNEFVDERADYILKCAYDGRLSGVDVVLCDAAGTRIRVARFSVENASGWSADMPGDNIWPFTESGSLSLVVRATAETVTSLAAMETVGARRYASNAYGLEQTTYKQKGGA